MTSFTGTLVDELKRFIRSNGKTPAIEGPPELQDALEDLCILIIRNAGHRGRKATKNARLNKNWYPDEIAVKPEYPDILQLRSKDQEL